jgi:hypothetical protein
MFIYINNNNYYLANLLIEEESLKLIELFNYIYSIFLLMYINIIFSDYFAKRKNDSIIFLV